MMRSVAAIILIPFIVEAQVKDSIDSGSDSGSTSALRSFMSSTSHQSGPKRLPSWTKGRRLLSKKSVELESGAIKQKDVSGADVAKAVFNLMKSIVGAGIVSLPSGVAAIGGDKSLLLPASILTTLMGIFSAYLFFLIGKLCITLGTSTYMTSWEKAFNKPSTAVVTVNTVIFPIMASLVYSIIIGDTFSALARGGILGPFMKANPIATDRRTWILAFAVGVLYPLSCLRQLSALSFTSLLGMAAIGYTGVMMVIRYLDGSYLPGGSLYKDALSVPSFEKGGGSIVNGLKELVSSPGSFSLMAMCGTAFNAHYNTPAFLEDMGGDLKKFGLVTVLGFGLSILINLVFLIFGFLTFGSGSQGVILNSYAGNDILAAIARVVFGIAVVFTYPVVYAGPKKIFLDFLKSKKFKDGGGYFSLLNQAVTLGPMILITLAAVLIANAGTVIAIVGATSGTALIYVLPTIMYAFGKVKGRNLPEKIGNIGLLALGALVTVLGVYTSVVPAPAPPVPKK